MNSSELIYYFFSIFVDALPISEYSRATTNYSVVRFEEDSKNLKKK